MRSFNRSAMQMRPVKLEPGVSRNAEGSCLVQFGYTRVLCTASVDNSIPPFLRNTGKGWVTAEYGMLPRATNTRNQRESAKGKVSGRTQEIQRLIGRSLRSVMNLAVLGERQIIIDCDVLEADGGTRTAAITGGYVALYQALNKLAKERQIPKQPIEHQVAAVSCGICKGQPLLDLDYSEDSGAEVDANFVMTSSGQLIEVQATGEANPFTNEQFQQLMELAQEGAKSLFALQAEAIASL